MVADIPIWLHTNRQLHLLLFYIGISFVHLFTGNAFPLAIGFFALFGTVFILMLRSKDRLILFDLLPAFAILGLWVVPAILYILQNRYPTFPFDYIMPIPSASYFAIAVPSVLAICIGSQLPLLWSAKDDDGILQQVQTQLNLHPWLPITLVAIGLLAYFLAPYLSTGWRQVGYYTSLLIWIGGIHALLAPRYKWANRILAIGVLFLLIAHALLTTMFGGMVFWLFFGLLYVQVAQKWAFWKLVLSGLVSVTLIIVLLTFKYQYRGLVTRAGGSSVLERVGLFAQAFKNRLADPFGDPWNLQQPLQRVNQGYHLALTYQHVPAQEPFANGATIKTALFSAFVPRLFWRDKPQAGGQTNYPRFTGKALLPNVSMNIGPAGDAYANFGAAGAVLFLLIYSFTLRLLYEGFRWLARHWYAPIWLWVPLVFFSCISIEMDVLIAWNDAVKGSIFILFSCSILHLLQRKSLPNKMVGQEYEG